jgi:hypothetical protein
MWVPNSATPIRKLMFYQPSYHDIWHDIWHDLFDSRRQKGCSSIIIRRTSTQSAYHLPLNDSPFQGVTSHLSFAEHESESTGSPGDSVAAREEFGHRTSVAIRPLCPSSRRSDWLKLTDLTRCFRPAAEGKIALHRVLLRFA